MYLKGWIWALLVTAVLLAATALRIYGLDLRMMHGDEAVHAFKYAEWIHGTYRYDLHDYHGPILYILTWPLMQSLGIHQLADMEPWQLRVITSVFGILLVAIVFLMARMIGRGAALAAAAFMCISPIMVFYSRYYVQEIVLSVAALGAIACTLGMIQPSEQRRPRHVWFYAIALGALFGLMHGTKETYFISVAALVAAVGVTWWMTRHEELPPNSPHAPRKPIDTIFLLQLVAVIFIAWIIVGSTLITGLWRDPAAVGESIRAWLAYAGRGTGTGEGGLHIQPWYFYFERLFLWIPGDGYIYTEAVIAAFALLAILLVALGRLHTRTRRAVIFLTAYTSVVMLAYEVIPYKTPWCALQFWTPMVILAGIGVADAPVLFHHRRWLSAAYALLLLACFTQLSYQTYRLNWAYPNPGMPLRNPWTYAHPVPDVANGAAEIARICAANPGGDRFLVAVVGPDLWPWPWYLRHQPYVGYWPDVASVTGSPEFIIAGEDDIKAVQERWPDHYAIVSRGQRVGVRKAVFVERQAMTTYAETRWKKGAPK